MYETKDTNIIKTFRDLIAWQKAHELVLRIYKVTDSFPSKGKFALTNQMRRSAVSVTSNIAEGFSRRTGKDKSQFYMMALGSRTELQSQVITSYDVSYINIEDYRALDQQSIIVHKLLNGLIKSSKALKNHT